MKAPEITAMAIAMVVACIPAASSGFTIISVKKAEQEHVTGSPLRPTATTC